MWEYKQTNELYHAGVKGMKWGVRKAGIAPTEKRKRSPVDGNPIRPEKRKPSQMPVKNINKAKSEKGKKIANGILQGVTAVTSIAALGGVIALGYGIGRSILDIADAFDFRGLRY